MTRVLWLYDVDKNGARFPVNGLAVSCDTWGMELTPNVDGGAAW
jgi:hypothetical protein